MGIFKVRVLAVTACLACAAFDVAHAELRFCNRTDWVTKVAIAYVERDAPGTTTNGHRGIVAEGYWSFEPGECASVSDMHVGNHYVWFTARAGSRTWAGEHLFCLPTKAFTAAVQFMARSEQCPSGTVMRGFHPIDANTRKYTMNIDP